MFCLFNSSKGRQSFLVSSGVNEEEFGDNKLSSNELLNVFELSNKDLGDSVFKLLNFNKINLKNGSRGWTLNGDFSLYGIDSGHILLKGSNILLNRVDGSLLQIDSNYSMLKSFESDITRAVLKDNVNFSFYENEDLFTQSINQLSITGDNFVYLLSEDSIVSDEMVIVSGQGFEISGDKLKMDIGPEKISLNGNVLSRFELSKVKPPDVSGM